MPGAGWGSREPKLLWAPWKISEGWQKGRDRRALVATQIAGSGIHPNAYHTTWETEEGPALMLAVRERPRS